jgi:ferrous iron transport protein B
MPTLAAAIQRRSVVVIGKESVGKSALIGSLTGHSAHASNFRGSTISCETYAYKNYNFVDTPGILRKSDTETTRLALAEVDHSDTVLMVTQATHLAEDLADLLPLVRGRRCVIVATFWDKINQGPDIVARTLDSLKSELAIHIIPVDARNVSADDRDAIVSALDQARPSQTESVRTVIGWLVPTPKSLLEHRVWGLAGATILLFAPACLAVWIANTVAGLIDPIVEKLLAPLADILHNSPSLIREISVGNYGLITMGPLLFVWAVPTVLLYALISGVYKASGLLDRISTTLHPLVRRIGLSGRDLVRILMGFGCNVPAVISTRACSSCSRSTAISTIAFGSACSYQFGATLAVFGAARRSYLVIPFLSYLAITTILYARLNSTAESRSHFNILVLEGRTFLTWPTPIAVWREAASTIQSFFRISLPIFFGITFIASIVAWTGILSQMVTFVRPLMGLFNLPPDAALPAIMACIRKDGILLFAKYDQIAALTDIQLLTAVYLAGELLPCLVTVLTIYREKSRRFVASLLLKQAIAAIVFSLVLAWGGALIVVPGNSDLIDTLGSGRSVHGAGLPSHSGRSSDGGAGSSPSTQRAAALGEATQTDLCGSISLGPVVAVLERLAVGPGHRETGDGDSLAPQRMSHDVASQATADDGKYLKTLGKCRK